MWPVPLSRAFVRLGGIATFVIHWSACGLNLPTPRKNERAVCTIEAETSLRDRDYRMCGMKVRTGQCIERVDDRIAHEVRGFRFDLMWTDTGIEIPVYNLILDKEREPEMR